MEDTTVNPDKDGVCRVCELIDNNTAIKPVIFCGVCGQYLCDECRPNYGKRARAAVKEFFINK